MILAVKLCTNKCGLLRHFFEKLALGSRLCWSSPVCGPTSSAQYMQLSETRYKSTNKVENRNHSTMCKNK